MASPATKAASPPVPQPPTLPTTMTSTANVWMSVRAITMVRQIGLAFLVDRLRFSLPLWNMGRRRCLAMCDQLPCWHLLRQRNHCHLCYYLPRQLLRLSRQSAVLHRRILPHLSSPILFRRYNCPLRHKLSQRLFRRQHNRKMSHLLLIGLFCWPKHQILCS